MTRVEVPKFVVGTELVWRLSRGTFRTGYHYALEDTAGHESADVEYSHLGYLKRVYVPMAEYRCRRGIGGKRGRIDVLDATTGEFVAAINLGRHGTITAGSHPTLRCTIKGRRAATATMAVVDARGAAVMTLRWTEAATSASGCSRRVARDPRRHRPGRRRDRGRRLPGLSRVRGRVLLGQATRSGRPTAGERTNAGRGGAAGRQPLTYNQMVVDLARAPEAERTDLLFHALADATRRDIVRLVLEGEHWCPTWLGATR